LIFFGLIRVSIEKYHMYGVLREKSRTEQEKKKNKRAFP
jgi:hypothetical protein